MNAAVKGVTGIVRVRVILNSPLRDRSFTTHLVIICKLLFAVISKIDCDRLGIPRIECIHTERQIQVIDAVLLYPGHCILVKLVIK